MQCLSVRLGNTLKFILLLDGVAVAGPLGRVDQLVSQTLRDRLDVAESSLTSSGAEQPDGLVDSPEGRHIDSLSRDSTSTSNTGGVSRGPELMMAWTRIWSGLSPVRRW